MLPGRRGWSSLGYGELTSPARRPVGCGQISLPFALSSLLSPYLRLVSWGRLPGRSCSEPPSAASGPRQRLPWGSGIRPAPPTPWSPLAAASAGTKRAGKKYHAVTGRTARGTGTRRAPSEGGVHPTVLGCQHTAPAVPSRLGHSCRYRASLQLGVFMVPHPVFPSVEVSCDLESAHQLLGTSLVGKAEKSLYTDKTRYTWAEWFCGLHCLYQNSGKAGGLLMGEKCV